MSDEQSRPEPGDPRPSVGVIGLGALGDGIAESLLRAGFPLAVRDVRSEATVGYEGRAEVIGSTPELVRRSDVVVVAVVDDAQVRAVLSGPDGGLAAARGLTTTFVVVSTISAGCVQAVGSEAAAAGVPMVDCGVSGGPSAAASGDLVCMVGGDPDVVGRIQTVFDAIGSLTVTMGPFGSGLAAKLARNLVQYGSWLAAYEGQVLAEATGIGLAELARVIKASDVHIGGVTALMFRPTVAPFTDRDDPGLVDAMKAAAALAHKDLRAAMELARELDVELPVAALTDDHCGEIFGLGSGR